VDGCVVTIAQTIRYHREIFRALWRG